MIIILFPMAVAFQNKFGAVLNHGIISYIIHMVDWNLLNYSSLLIWLIPIWYFSLTICNAYQSFRLKYIPDTLFTIIHSAVIATVLSCIVFYLYGFKTHDPNAIPLSYSIVLIYPAMCVFALIMSRILLIAVFRLVRRFGYNQRQIIIVGTGPRAIKHYRKIINNPEWGFHIIGFVALEKNDILEEELSRYSIIGTCDEMDKILDEYPVDDVFFVVPRKWIDQVEPAVMACDIVGATVHFAIDLFSIKVSKSNLSYFHGLPVLSLNATSTNYSTLALKRILDVIVSGSVIILFFPFGIVFAILIKLLSRGPVFFVQKRNTLNGRVFNMLKFRTMVQNAEELKEGLMSENDQDGPVFKMKTDPRITKFGKFLRKYSIDEMPQFINVFTGNMSLVGPRPPIPKEVRQYEPWQRRRLSMRPGITCIWQVSGRNDIEFSQWMEMDLYYIDHWSLFLDLKILLRTIPSVLLARGSH